MNQKQKVLVTGGTGFVGQHLLQRLLIDLHLAPISATRLSTRLPLSIQSVVVGDINGHTDWAQALAGVDTVVHTAARVHVMKEVAGDPLAAFRYKARLTWRGKQRRRGCGGLCFSVL
jgi:nucleoside-diphosphate-sugar epimerase